MQAQQAQQANQDTDQAAPLPLRASGTSKLRTISQLEPLKYCDFIGEVFYFKAEYASNNRVDGPSNRAVILMSDYTEHELVPPSEIDGIYRVMVTLWDEHFQTAEELDIKVGQFLYLKNMICKLGKSNKIELNMHGYRGKGYKQTEPVQVLNSRDPIIAVLRRRKAQYVIEHTRAEEEMSSISRNMSSSSSETAAVNNSSAVIPKQPVASTSSGPSRTSHAPKPGPQRGLESELEEELDHDSVPEKVPRLKREPGQASSTSSSVQASTSRTTTASKRRDEPLNRTTPPPLTRGPTPQNNLANDPDSVPSPTFIHKDKLKQQVRNRLAPQAGCYIMVQARVTAFEPRCIKDFSSAVCGLCRFKYKLLSEENLPPTCPQCNARGGSAFMYDFVLKLDDEFGQSYNVRVDNDGAITLLGIGDAGNFYRGQQRERVDKLKEKLIRIGINESLPPEGSSIYFNCCLWLPAAQSENPNYGGIDKGGLVNEDESSSQGSQSSQGPSHKRLSNNAEDRQGKKPCYGLGAGPVIAKEPTCLPAHLHYTSIV
ncbi:hypothetical protein BGZ65_008496 [Modicella reniformis]|uniref:Protection of telomeres protein 1 ssDNA-binding domain-containing protein n=1 Tax=Modicella reniformis TaxID=1440133 RepID=A0A9P6SS21_9FUNG|nr:hypothetical protein BGZ65_008496 [Modicella reniformis]